MYMATCTHWSVHQNFWTCDQESAFLASATGIFLCIPQCENYLCRCFSSRKDWSDLLCCWIPLLAFPDSPELTLGMETEGISCSEVLSEVFPLPQSFYCVMNDFLVSCHLCNAYHLPNQGHCLIRTDTKGEEYCSVCPGPKVIIDFQLLCFGGISWDSSGTIHSCGFCTIHGNLGTENN